MRSVNWKELVRVCKEEGCVFDRQRGDHYIMTRPGMARPIVIPGKRDLKERIVLNIAKTLGLTRNEILDRLRRRKSSQRKRH